MARDETTKPALGPNPFLHFSFLATQAMATALEVGVFRKLVDGPASPQALARSLKANRRALTRVLNALVGLNVLVRDGENVALSDYYEALLACPGTNAETYFAAGAEHLKRLMADWGRLTEVVKTGKPLEHLTPDKERGEMFVPLTEHIFPGNYLQAKRVVAQLPGRFRKQPLKVLDLAAGSAAWSIPFLEANPAAEAVAVDFAPVLDVARHFAGACGVEERYEFRAGDIRTIRLEREHYDVVTLGHICHGEGATWSRRLFKKVGKALRPGGTMLVAEFIADKTRSGEGTGPFPLFFALNMLVHSGEGDTFTLPELAAWGREAGFRRPRSVEAGGPSPLLLFTK